MKIGVELEYWVINQKGKLVSSEKLSEKLDFAEQEFIEPLVEIKTQPNKNFKEIEKEIISKLKELVRTAERQDQRIVPLGTPLNSQNIEKIPSERGEVQEKIIGKDLEAAKRVAGTHIHFEKKDIKQQLNTLTALDPALALTNSSLYYHGQKVASSSRSHVYRNKCYQNFPEHGQLWDYVESVEEWNNKITETFEEFISSAQKQGITKEKINQNFKPENALWTPVRLRKDFPTVEWRAPDAGNLPDTLRMIEEIKEVMENKQDYSKPSFIELKNLSEKAILEGLQNEEVRDYLRSYGFSVDKYSPITGELEAGEELTLEEARKIRLKVAEQFHQTVLPY